MTKYEWETELKKCMHRLPKAEQDKVLEYYGELFADQAENGMSEKQIINEFGNPSDVAFKIMTDYGMDVNVSAETAVAVPEFNFAKTGERITPPDFWSDRTVPKAHANAQSERDARDARHERAERREDRAMRREDRRERHMVSDASESGENNTRSAASAHRRGLGSAVAFLIEVVIFGGLFIGLAAVIVSFGFAVLTFGYASAAGAVYAAICTFMPGLEMGVRLVNGAVALAFAGIACFIVPNTVRIVKSCVKWIKGCWNLFFGWFTKKREAK